MKNRPITKSKIFLSLSSLKRGALGVIIIFLFPSIGFSENTDFISKAEKLTLSGQRAEALQLLAEAIPKESVLSQRRNLILKMKKLSEVFYKDDTQKKFSSALSIAPKEPELSLKKLRALLMIEPENAFIFNTIVKILLLEKKCSSALSMTYPKFTKNPYLLQNTLLQLQAQLCLSDFDGFVQTEEKLTEVEKVLKQVMSAPHWESLGHFYIKKQELSELRLHMKKAFKGESTEKPYFLWKLSSEGSADKEQQAQNYLEICPQEAEKLILTKPSFAYSCEYREEVKKFLEARGQTGVKETDDTEN